MSSTRETFPSGAPTLELHSWDAMLSWIHEVVPYGVFTTDENLVIRSWNQWLAMHSGRAPSTVIGRGLLEIFPEIGTRKLERHYRRALSGEVSVLSSALHKYLIPLPVSVKDYGAPFMLQTARIAPLPFNGQFVGTVTIIEDVTQRVCQDQALRRQLQHDRLLSELLSLLLQSQRPLELAPELLARISGPLQLDVCWGYLLAPDGTMLELQVSAGLSDHAKTSMLAVAIGDGFCGAVAAQRAPRVEDHVQANQSAAASVSRAFGLRSYAGFPLLVGERLLGIIAFGSCSRDVIAPDEVDFLTKLAVQIAIALDRTQRAQALAEAQERLREHADDLEEKISVRTAKLKDTIAQLESFSYTIAHDLRGPIRSLIGFSEILLSDFSAAVPEEGLMLLRRLHRASNTLDALTRDLLRFSQLVRGEVQLTPVNVGEILEDIISVTPALQHRTLTLQPPLGNVLAQRTLLQQCLSNLLDNALKFACPDRRPHIVVRTEDRITSTASPRTTAAFHPSTTGVSAQQRPCRRIWVEDNGIGIDPLGHEKVFGIFERIPGPVPIDGTGIGLAIVARATEQMGGTCGVESTLGQGSRFWMEFGIPDDPAT